VIAVKKRETIKSKNKGYSLWWEKKLTESKWRHPVALKYQREKLPAEGEEVKKVRVREEQYSEVNSERKREMSDRQSKCKWKWP
jgi:hypothetical protein